MPVAEFENIRWQKAQAEVFRHMAAADLIEGGPVLDLGCGDGLLLETLQKRGINSQGLDVSPTAIDKCAKRGVKAQVFDFADEPLPYPDNTFEYVVILDVLEHLYFPTQVLREAKRVSRKFVIVGVPNFSSLPARIQVLRGWVPENNKPNKGHIFWFNFFNLTKILKEANLRIVRLQSNTFWQSRSLLAGLISFLARRLPNLFSLSFVAKAEK